MIRARMMLAHQIFVAITHPFAKSFMLILFAPPQEGMRAVVN
jgi:hypothetical protein